MSRLYDVRAFPMRKHSSEKIEHFEKGYRLNAAPMSHDQACAFKSKFINRECRVIELVEVSAIKKTLEG